MNEKQTFLKLLSYYHIFFCNKSFYIKKEGTWSQSFGLHCLISWFSIEEKQTDNKWVEHKTQTVGTEQGREKKNTTMTASSWLILHIVGIPELEVGVGVKHQQKGVSGSKHWPIQGVRANALQMH